MSMPVRPPDGVAELNDNAKTVISKRYLIKDASGKPTEQPEEMFWRVATTVAEADRRHGATDADVTATASEFYALMTQRRFEPNCFRDHFEARSELSTDCREPSCEPARRARARQLRDVDSRTRSISIGEHRQPASQQRDLRAACALLRTENLRGDSSRS